MAIPVIRISLAVLALLASAQSASAIERIATVTKSCAAIQRILVQNGAAILRYPARSGSGVTLYDRYVGYSRFCGSGEIGKWASVPSKSGQCRVIACERWEPEDELFPFSRKRHAFRLRIRLD